MLFSILQLRNRAYWLNRENVTCAREFRLTANLLLQLDNFTHKQSCVSIIIIVCKNVLLIMGYKRANPGDFYCSWSLQQLSKEAL